MWERLLNYLSSRGVFSLVRLLILRSEATKDLKRSFSPSGFRMSPSSRKTLRGLILSIGLVGMVSICLAQEMHKHHHMMAEEHYAVEEEAQDLGICPVMQGKASKEYSYTYDGKTYYFCCPGCIEEFEKDPQKYISKIKEIHLEAYQFGFTPEKIVVKKGDIVKIFSSSRDVPHGIYIKEYDINVPVKKGEIKKIEFVADKNGEFEILCSVYCGRGHSTMKAKLVVE